MLNDYFILNHQTMARKVFISFLGINNYVQSYYTIDDFKSSPTRFIQQALIELVCKDWTEDDQIYIFCTKDAYNINYLPECTNEMKTENVGLGTILENWKKDNHNPLLPKYEAVEIPEGFSKEEIWRIFDIVYKKLNDGDQIYFDITHAFRSIPLLGVTLFDYAKYLKKTQFVSVYYGAFEKLGPAYKVKEMDLKDRLAPIVDMTEVINLQRCTEIANGVTSYGRMNVLADELKKDSKLLEIGESIQTLDETLSGNIGDELREGKFMTVMQQGKRKIKSSSLFNPIKEIFQNVLNKLENFKANGNIDNYLAAARWTFKYHLLPQSYSFGKEYINREAWRKLKSWNPFPPGKDQKKDYLEMINVILSLQEKDVKNENYKYALLEYIDVTRDILALPWVQELRKYYVEFNDNRNAVIHIKPNYKYDDLKSYFEKNFEVCVKIVQDAPVVEK